MARDHRHHHRHHASGAASSNTTSSHGTGSNGKSNTVNNIYNEKNGGSSSSSSSRRYRVPNPPVPHAQASLLQVVPPTTRVSASSAPAPASMNHRHGNDHLRQSHHRRQLLSTTTSDHSNRVNTNLIQEVQPVGDPEAMDAKKGLNEWGAFGGGGSGTGAGGPGTFGFGLFHHHGVGGDSGSSEDDEKTPCTSTASRDPFEIHQLLMGDPISFNPLQAISWAKLDDEPMAEDGSGMGGRSATSTDTNVEYGTVRAARTTSGFQQVCHSEHPAQRVVSSPTTSTSSAMMSAEAVQRGTARNSPYGAYAADHSPVGNVSQTLSAVTLSSRTPEVTNVYNNSSGKNSTVVPAVLPAAGRVSETKGSHSTGSRQQNRERRQRHRQPRETKKSSGAHAATTISVPTPQHSYSNDPYQRQEHAFPPPPPPSFASSLQPVFSQPPAVFQQELQYQQQALPPPPAPAYGNYAISESHPPPGLQQQQQQQLLLCLAPSCSARFRSEPELNAHYRAEHSFMCNWASCKSVSFTSNNALVWHVKAEHLLLCPVPGCCDRVFASKKALDGHVRVG